MTDSSNQRVTVTFDANGNIVENNQFSNLSNEQKQSARDFAKDVIGAQSSIISELANGNSFINKPFIAVDLTVSYLNYRDEQHSTNPYHQQTLSDEIGAGFNAVASVIGGGVLATQGALAGAAIFSATPIIGAIGGAVIVGYLSGEAYDAFVKDNVNSIVDYYFGNQEPSGSVALTLNSKSQSSLKSPSQI